MRNDIHLSVDLECGLECVLFALQRGARVRLETPLTTHFARNQVAFQAHFHPHFLSHYLFPLLQYEISSCLRARVCARNETPFSGGKPPIVPTIGNECDLISSALAGAFQ